jgi:hypothetical protein
VALASAEAATVGLGQMTVNTAAQTTETVFQDQTLSVFGTPVDLGTAMLSLSGSYTLSNFVPYGGMYDWHLQSDPVDALVAESIGNYICDTVDCTGAVTSASFIGPFSNVTGTALASLPSDLVYIHDGTLVGGSPSLPVFAVAINAFQPEPTPSSPPGCSGTDCAVTVAPPPTTVTNSATGDEVIVSATVVFPAVTGGGVATVTAVSNVAAELSANFAFNAGVTFIDISTTATYDTSAAPIAVCVDYAVAGTVADVSALRLLHDESGTWVDVTTSLDTDAHVICGAVSSLSPFAVASEFPPTTTSTSTTSSTSTSSTTSTTIPATADALLSGKKLALVASPDAAKRKLSAQSTDPAIALGAGNGSIDDPSQPAVTTTVRVVGSGSDAFDTTYGLPSNGWRPIGKPGANKGYKFKSSTNTPISSATIKAGKLVKVSGRGSGLPFTLATSPDPVLIVVQVGTVRYCFGFGGTVKFTPAKRYVATDSPSPAVCP